MHWHMELSIHFGQSGNAGRTPNSLLTLFPLSLTFPFSPNTHAAFLSLLPAERSHHATLSLLYGTDNDLTDCHFASVSQKSLLAFRYNHFLPITTPIPRVVTIHFYFHFPFRMPSPRSSVHGSAQRNPSPFSVACKYVRGQDAPCSLQRSL